MRLINEYNNRKLISKIKKDIYFRYSVEVRVIKTEEEYSIQVYVASPHIKYRKEWTEVFFVGREVSYKNKEEHYKKIWQTIECNIEQVIWWNTR